MKRSVWTLLTIIFISLPLFGQAHSGLSVQVGITKITDISTQGLVTYIHKLNKNFVITAGLGYSSFNGGLHKLSLERYQYATKYKVKSIIPFQIGGRYYYATEGFNPCIIFEWGINRMEQEVQIPVSGIPGQSPPQYVSKNRTVLDISYGIGFGALIPVMDQLNIDVSFVAHQKMEIGDYVSFMVGANYIL